MISGIRLLPIERDGTVAGFHGEPPGEFADVLEATKYVYLKTGFERPWICYLALHRDAVVGTCAFKSPPVDRRIEIAYYTFPEFEGKGIATAMAAELIALAHHYAPRLTIAAQTLPERNASHRILEKLGFVHVTTLDDPEDGTVWEWRLPDTAMPAETAWDP